MTKTQRYFSTACLLVGALLVKFGAPVPAVAAGLALAATVNWKLGAFRAR